jgi:transposase
VKSRNNSGFVEGINNKIKVMKRRCYGISNIKHFFQRVFLDLQGYAQYAANSKV